jgi:hypothetical protein
MPLGLGTIGRLTIGGVPAQFTFVVASGSFTFAGQPAGFHEEPVVVGSSISGGTFSRRRWRDMLAAEDAARAAQARRDRDARLRRTAERRRREAAFAAARERARIDAKVRGDAAVAALAQLHAAAAVRGVEQLRETAALASAQAAATARMAAQAHDDDEAIALLLLAQHGG